MTLLATGTRKLYTDCLTAPDGYRFDRGVATTFTLSLETLLILPFTLATQGAEDPEQLMRDPAVLLESLQETTHRLAVFCHEGYTSVPAKGQLLYGHLDRCVVPVRLPKPGQFFHPKLWLLRFVGEDPDDVVLRAVVLSRNLTFDRSWDTVLCLDGTPTGRRVKDSFGLETLVGALPGLATTPVSTQQRELCEMLAQEAAQTRFETPQPFNGGPVFHAVGVRDKKGRRLRFEPAPEGNTKRMLCVSPFLSAQTMATARAFVRKKPMLITRDASAQLIEDDVLADWDVRVLADAVETGESADDESQEAATHHLAPSGGLHAKVCVYENTQGRATWFLGSANLTGFGWPGLNVELMVELSGGAKACGIDAFLEGGFSDVLEEWKRSEIDPDLEAQEALRSRAEAFRDEVVQADLHLRCVPPGESESWGLELLGDPPEAPEGIQCTAWPVTAELAVYEKRLGSGQIRWEMNSPAELTGLIVFCVRATQSEPKHHSETVRFVLRLPVEGMPEDRDAHILRALVKDTRGFFRYLRYLLSSDDEGIPGLASPGRKGSTDGAGGFALGFEEVILEDLVRGVSRNPERMRVLGRRIEALRATEESAAVIPASFLRLWDMVASTLPPQDKQGAQS